MTDLKGHFDRMLADEPPLFNQQGSDGVERVVTEGRQARRRRRLRTALAGGAGMAAMAAVVVPVALVAGSDRAGPQVSVLNHPTPTHAPTTAAKRGHCVFYIFKGKLSKQHMSGAMRRQAKVLTKDGHKLFYTCPPGVQLPKTPDAQADEPTGPRYHYSEDPTTIAARFAKHLSARVDSFGLTVNYTRPFAQETSTLEHGHPSYFDGNVDIQEAQGYGDIGVQVTHAVTTQVPANQSCNDSSTTNCTTTTLADGSTLQTAELHVGRGDIILTAEVHRPDGLVVQAQESNYPFGPDAGSEAHGSQPLTLDQLVSLAEDPDFSF